MPYPLTQNFVLGDDDGSPNSIQRNREEFLNNNPIATIEDYWNALVAREAKRAEDLAQLHESGGSQGDPNTLQAYAEPEANPALKQYTGPQPTFDTPPKPAVSGKYSLPRDPLNFKERNWSFLNDGSKTVEIPGYGIAEFPDEMSPDDIKGVIQKKFFPETATSAPTPAQKPFSLREYFGKALGTARDIGTEALSGISPELSAQVFGQTAESLRPEQISQPLISKENARAFVGDLPAWAGGQTQLAQGIAEATAGALSETSRPGTLAQLPAFAIPGVAETYAANVVSDVPKQYKHVRDTINEFGPLSKEAGAALAEAGITDATAFLAGKTSTAGRALPSLGESLRSITEGKPLEAAPEVARQLVTETPAEPVSAPVEIPPGSPESALARPTSSEIAPATDRLAIAQKALSDARASGDTAAETAALSEIDGIAAEMMAPSKAASAAANENVTVNPEINPSREISDTTVLHPEDTEMVKKSVESLGLKYDRTFQDAEGNQRIQVTDTRPGREDTYQIAAGETVADLKARLAEKDAQYADAAKDTGNAKLKVEPFAFTTSGRNTPGITITDNVRGNETAIIEAERLKDGTLQVYNAQIEPSQRGAGKGVALYEKLFEEAKGSRVVSDASVSESAARVWDSLKRKGHDIEKNPNARLQDDETGRGTSQWITSDGSPVYKFTPPEGAQESAVGSIGPGAQTLSALSPAQVVRPIKSQRQIITDLAKGLDVPIRFGRLRTSKFAGYFMPKADLIASKRPNDLTTVTHEVGHKLDREFDFSGDKTIRAELNVLGDPKTQGSFSSWTKSKTLKYKYGEGIAEFVRYWLTDPKKAEQVAPATHAAFEKILDANKDVGDVLRQAQDDIAVWRTSESQARLRSHISIGDNPNKTRYTVSQLTRDLVDDLHILRLASDDAAKHLGRDLEPSKNPYLLARNLRGSYGMADTFVREGVSDFKTRAVELGTSLEDALKPIAGRVSDFRDWIVAKRAQELMAQGRETGLLADDVAAVVKRFNADPEFQKAFQAVKVWNANVLKYAVDSGLVTPEGATAMLEMNNDYVPFHRVFEVGAGESSSQQTLGTGSGLNAGKPGSLKKMSGSRREIVDPIETMVKNAYAIITASEKASINNAVADLSRLPNMGRWVEHVAAPKEQVKVGVEKIREQLEASGADVSNVPDDLLLTFYRQSGRAPFGENTIRVVRNGKPEFYRLNHDLFDTFHALDLEDSGKLVRFLAAPAQLLRSGVVLEPSFALANAMRDTFSAAVIGKYGALPFETTARGIGAMIGNPKLVAEWAASGGKSSIEANYFDRAKLQSFLTEKITKDLTPSERALLVLKSPLTALRYLTGISEEATRIGEYQIALKKLVKSGMPEGEARRLAAFEARDRQDFAKGGAKTKTIRHLSAFWNAGLQANVKLLQAFKERPIRTLAQGAAFITIPKLLEQAVNWNDEDYWDRPQWERDLFFMIPAGKDESGHTRFLRIPTPFEVGVLFGTLPGRILQYAHQQDPEALTGYFNTLLQQSVPNPIPQSLQMIFEDFLSGKQGWDIYRGRPIVPDSLANQPPELQWTEQTSTLAKKVGEKLGYSPMKIDHIINQTTGGLGKVLSGQQVPGKRFVTTPLTVSNQTTQDFYDTLEELRADKKRAEAGAEGDYQADKLSLFEKTAREMSELRKEMRQADGDARKSELREEIYRKARSAINPDYQ